MSSTRNHLGRTRLPVLGEAAPERSDAVRNRQALLATAQTILDDEGLDGLSLDRLAREAGVGVGTVYRRFGDRAGLSEALLDARERRFQEAFLSGPPPLGPGAPPADRLRAFLHACMDRLEDEVDLRAWGESRSATGPYSVGAYQASWAQVRTLLGLAGVPGDLDYMADALLATTKVQLFLHQRRERGLSLERIKSGVDQLLDGLLPS